MIATEYINKNVFMITISRQNKLNAFNREGLELLINALERVEEDNNIASVIITGSGEKAFCCGADIKDYENISVKDALDFLELGQKAVKKLEETKVPIIAAVNGYALGGGCEIALGCDMRIASDNARFGLPEIHLGLFPGWGGTQRMRHLVGDTRAAQLIYTGDQIDASVAKEWGLVNSVVPQEQLRDETIRLATSISNKPREVLTRIKKMFILNKDTQDPMLQLEATLLSTCYELPETKELINSFINKKKK